MFASLLYHTNQIEDVQVLKDEYHSDKILFEAVLTPKDMGSGEIWGQACVNAEGVA